MSNKSKHYGWQARWKLDNINRTARHDNGLVVQILPSGAVEVQNEPQVIIDLTPKNGHNAMEMVKRMAREGKKLLDEGPRAKYRTEG